MFKDELEDEIGPKWVKRLGFVVGVLFVYFCVAFVFSIFPFNVGAKLVNKVVNADAIVANYEWFFDQKNAIDAQITNITNLEQQIDKGSESFRERKMIELSGLRMVVNNMIGEYNSKSKQTTRKLWKSDTLPYQINNI